MHKKFQLLLEEEFDYDAEDLFRQSYKTNYYIPFSHFCKYPGPTSQKHTTFANQGRDIHKSLKGGNELFPNTIS